MEGQGNDVGRWISDKILKAEPLEIPKEWQTIVEDLVEKLALKYRIKKTDLEKLKQDLNAVQKAFGDIANLQGKRILDIGCGSTPPEDDYVGFEPWFCRALKELGANPVGIELHHLDGETFENYGLNLANPGALNIFSDKSFDAINSTLFLGSPKFVGDMSADELERIKREIATQIKRLLKDDGKILNMYYIEDDKVKGELGF